MHTLVGTLYPLFQQLSLICQPCDRAIISQQVARFADVLIVQGKPVLVHPLSNQCENGWD